MKRIFGSLVLLVAFAAASCSGVRFVDQVKIENPTAFPASVSVTDGSRDGWLGLATVAAHSDTTVQEVIDQGTTWVFRFSFLHYEEETSIGRAELEGSGWRIEVPESFASALRARGTSPPP